MNPWIKICGLTEPAGVEAAVDAGVDAIGFVFASSKRRVTTALARTLADTIPTGIARVAVMLHPLQSLLDQVLEEFEPDLLQTDLEDFDVLTVPAGLGRLAVLRSGSPMPGRLPARVLYEGARSGTGETPDWLEASALARRTRLVLAGGLRPDNVAEALAAVRPFGIDVSTGVETLPGVKSRGRIMEFVAAARAAALHTQGETG